MEQHRQRAVQDDQAEANMACLFGGLLWQVRWAVLASIMLLSFAQPMVGRTGWPTWGLTLLFVLYNLGLELLRRTTSLLDAPPAVPLLDLPAIIALFVVSAAPGGPLYVLVLLIVTCAAATLSLRASLIYTALTAALMALIAPTMPLWAGTVWQLRELGAELLIIILVGAGTALLTRQLTRTKAQADASRNEALRQAALNELRTHFFANISHDLRTPLTAVKASLGLLDQSAHDRLHSEERRLVANARRNVDRLTSYIGDLLALNQLEAGVLQLDSEPLDLREVVTAALPVVEPLIEQKEQQLTVTLPVQLPVHGDRRRLEQVVVNLLANAHEHTPAGTKITIGGQTTLETTSLIIADTGPGIPTAAHEHIFKAFQQLDRDRNGSGLGLAIVRGIVQLHHGQICIVSATGAGTTLRLSFPRADGLP